jgi:hypothetical protein
MASASLYQRSDEDLHRIESGPRMRKRIEEAIGKDGAAAKAYTTDEKTPPMRIMQVAGVQPFYIPAKVPEQDEVRIETHSIDTVMDVMPDFDFETDTGTWISANPLAHESRSSLATTVTAGSTLVDDRSTHRALSLDTSVTSSSASMRSAFSTTSTDVYGWEEELDRKTSIESHTAWEREMPRRLPSGGRTPGPRPGYPATGEFSNYNYKRANGKRKSLLYRVMHISGHRKTIDEPPLPTTTIQPTNDDLSTTVPSPPSRQMNF